MADPEAPDPMALFRQMAAQWERMSRDAAAAAQPSPGFGVDLGPEFGKAMTQVGSFSAAAQQSFGEAVGRVMTGMNLPNRAEVLEISAQVTALGARLERIEAMLATLTGTVGDPVRAAVPRPPRTRRPPP